MVRTCSLLMAFFAASPRRRCEGEDREAVYNYKQVQTDMLRSGLFGAYLVAVPGIGVAEPLNVVEDKPGQRDDH